MTLSGAQAAITRGTPFCDVYPLVPDADKARLAAWFVADTGVPNLDARKAAKMAAARETNYTGDTCGACGSMKMIRTGPCQTCQSCGSTDGGCG